MKQPYEKDQPRPKIDSAYWQMATVAIPLAAALATGVFGFVAAVSDQASRSIELSGNTVFATVIGVMAAVAALLALRRTPRTLGAATGILTVALLVVFVWLAPV
ncbi:hypothetical protein [Nocardia sp. NPDC051832]|uniref:hypothetical protein n=1 Tax=Nocardia sp. NPDC051832 TaxID=3155673 RepID=UPI003445EA6E